MPKRQTPIQRLMSFFITAPIGEAQQALETIQAVLAARRSLELPAATARTVAQRRPRSPRAETPNEPAA